MSSIDELLENPNVETRSRRMHLDIPLQQAEDDTVPSTADDSDSTAFKNIEMERMIDILGKHLSRTDIIGYAAARNTRILRSEGREYFERREQLIHKHGKPQLADDGKPTGLFELKVGTPEFEKFASEIEQFAIIEHKPNIFKLKYSEAIGKLSGNELLELEWMFED